MDPKLTGENNVTFLINGKVYQAGAEVDGDTSLNTYIREVANLKGTKYMCKEGGCGACIVSMTAAHPVTKLDQTFAVNSCLVPVFACHGAAITTVEGIGDKTQGYHPAQSNLAHSNGTQCGYCSPGFVMNMYSLMKSKPKLTMEEVENSFGGNICRCTGYRPILDAYKSLACDAPPHLKAKIADIEDLIGGCCIKGSGYKDRCSDCPQRENNKIFEKNEWKKGGEDDVEPEGNYEGIFVEVALAPRSLQVKLRGGLFWYRVTQVSQIFQLYDYLDNNTYMLVAGNTAQGVYKPAVSPKFYIDINDVAELKEITILNDRILIGANVTLTELINLFNGISEENQLLYAYTKGLADHIDLVANVPVRNRGTLAGNLMIKHTHREFPSDIFLIMETCGAQITIRDLSGIENTMSLLEFLETDMYKKVILSVSVPALSCLHYIYRSFKIMPRKQNVHAYVNAGFLFRIDKYKSVVEERPNMVFGGINPHFTHAFTTESFIVSRSLLDQEVLTAALSSLSSELQPDIEPPEASPEYRKKLALSLFYRFVLGVNYTNVNPEYRSGADNLYRPLSSGIQEYDINPNERPVHLPVQKLEAQVQCSGEAEYVDDMPKLPGQLYGALVISDRARAKIVAVNPAPALNIPGVLAFFNDKDIPGVNTFIVQNILSPEDEELFCSGDVLYAGQPIGMVVATTQELAIKAAAAVQVKYSDESKPLLTIREVLKSGDKSRIRLQGTIEPVHTQSDIAYKIVGEVEMGPQYHFSMELQTCVVVPIEDGLNVYSATQWMHSVQGAISKVLNIPLNGINVEVRRLGGAYGCKISRCALVATACALAAHKLQKPVRMMLDMRTNMRAIGKRCPVLSQYEVGVNEEGRIQYLNVNMYEDYGCSWNDNVVLYTRDGVKSCYDFSNWKVNIISVKTDTPGSTWMRAPGTLEGMVTIEHIMEHIAQVTKRDSLDVRRINFIAESKSDIEDVIKEVKDSSNYEWRIVELQKYNSENRWKKRAVSLMPMKFGVFFFPNFHSMVSIFSEDGTVAVTTGGIEMGQGLNTKVAQVCAFKLGIDLSMIKIKPCLNTVAPNCKPTAGSMTSDTICYATLRCCEELNRRLGPIKDKLKKPLWREVIKLADLEGVNLNSTYMYTLTDPIPQNYSVYGATVLEVELDVLTGQYQVLRVDLVEDVGESLSPAIDIGQIEGAFVMGLGYFSSEQLVFHETSGQLLTDRTWTYWPPGAKDIPIDFRIAMRKNASNPKGVLRSKTTGEPPLCMSQTLVLALREALRSARKDAGLPDEWFTFNPPCTFEKTFLAGGTSPENFYL